MLAVFGTLVVTTATFLLGIVCAKPLLFVEGGSRHADVIVVLGGDAGDRAFRALELFKGGAAPKILVSGDGDGVLIRNRLVLAGVGTNEIIMESNSGNTKQNAEFSIRLMKEQRMTRAIVVTSWFHSRRALACFRSFDGDIEFSSFPAYNGINMEHKPSLSEAPLVVHEYFGIAWYLLRYGIVPASPLEHTRP